MATIKRHLDDIEKLVAKSQQTTRQQLDEVINELKDFDEFNFGGETHREKTLIQAKNILENKLQYEEIENKIKDNKYNNFIQKENKKNIDIELFNILKSYFIKYKNISSSVYDTLKENETTEEIANDLIKKYGTEYQLYIYDAYIKQLNKLKKLYQEEIKQEEERHKQKASTKSNKKTNILKGVRNGALIFTGLMMLSERKKRR